MCRAYYKNVSFLASPKPVVRALDVIPAAGSFQPNFSEPRVSVARARFPIAAARLQSRRKGHGARLLTIMRRDNASLSPRIIAAIPAPSLTATCDSAPRENRQTAKDYSPERRNRSALGAGNDEQLQQPSGTVCLPRHAGRLRPTATA